MKAVFSALFGTILTAAIVILVLFFYFRVSVSPVTTDLATAEETVVTAESAQQSGGQQVAAERLSNTSANQSNTDPQSDLYMPGTWPRLTRALSLPGLSVHKTYGEREKEFVDAVRLQLGYQINTVRYNIFLTVEDHIVYIELGFKSLDNTHRLLTELTDAAVWNDFEKESWDDLKDSLCSVSSAVKKAAEDAGLTDTQVAAAFINSMSMEPLVVTLDDMVFYDFFENFSGPAELTAAQRAAIVRARQLLLASPMSKLMLLDALLNERGDQYSADDCLFALNFLEEQGLVDWEEQAIRMAILRLSAAPYSRDGLIRQLSSDTGDRFSSWQATNAANHLEENALVDWLEQAKLSARRLLAQDNYSRNELELLLTIKEAEAYTWEEATGALDALGIH
ncbi:MAG: Ltp family lipoprotein [Lachnospiraceae bacterium]|nr:Ltp family lipoprotein [Lachnospiraceae bacterium]